jgi:16S rRNA (cytosine967-C5)-methyltransferase
LILDACAAPGGKSTHLAELIGDQGQVVALDRAEARLRRVVRNSERLGLRCVEPHQADAAQWAQQHPHWLSRFDRILVDAPCSGLGTLARHADARWRIAPDAIDALTVLQRQLLEGLLPLLKPGGLMVYATCTVHPAENSALIESFLSSFSGLLLEKQFQSWPGEMQGGGDGFFAAVMRLNESC